MTDIYSVLARARIPRTERVKEDVPASNAALEAEHMMSEEYRTRVTQLESELATERESKKEMQAELVIARADRASMERAYQMESEARVRAEQDAAMHRLNAQSAISANLQAAMNYQGKIEKLMSQPPPKVSGPSGWTMEILYDAADKARQVVARRSEV